MHRHALGSQKGFVSLEIGVIGAYILRMLGSELCPLEEHFSSSHFKDLLLLLFWL